MAFSKTFSGRRKWALVALVVAGTLVWVWLGLLQDKGGTAAPVVGKRAPQAASTTAKNDSAFTDANARLEELLRRQQLLGQQAGEPAGAKKTEAVPASRVQAANAVSGKAAGAEVQRQRMESLMAARDTAVKEIMAAGPGDTKRVIAAIENLDAQMRALGMPSVIDMPKFRQMMLGAEHIQDISRRLTEENQKGKQADPAKLQSLLGELSAAQAAMPKTPYNMDAIERMQKSGR